jgi:hypothetical protein
MALRFTRGLFRLWIVLTVLWVVTVGFVTWVTMPEDPRTWGAIPIDNTDLPNPSAQGRIWRATEFALMPPILVFAIGSAFVWVSRGFR